MPTKSLSVSHRRFIKALGEFIENKVLNELGYKSLDAFSLMHHDNISKKTLYALCSGDRDIKLSTLLGLAEALDMPASEILAQVKRTK